MLGHARVPPVLLTLTTFLMLNVGSIPETLDMAEYFAGEMAVPHLNHTQLTNSPVDLNIYIYLSIYLSIYILHHVPPVPSPHIQSFGSTTTASGCQGHHGLGIQRVSIVPLRDPSPPEHGHTLYHWVPWFELGRHIVVSQHANWC